MVAQAQALNNVTHKPWGNELLLASNELYTVKQIYVREKQRLSLQYHTKKVESMTCVHGKGHLELYRPDGSLVFSGYMQPYAPYHIPAYYTHRLSAPDEDIIVVETSTTHPEDVVRLHDDYGRLPDAE